MNGRWGLKEEVDTVCPASLEASLRSVHRRFAAVGSRGVASSRVLRVDGFDRFHRAGLVTRCLARIHAIESLGPGS